MPQLTSCPPVAHIFPTSASAPRSCANPRLDHDKEKTEGRFPCRICALTSKSAVSLMDTMRHAQIAPSPNVGPYDSSVPKAVTQAQSAPKSTTNSAMRSLLLFCKVIAVPSAAMMTLFALLLAAAFRSSGSGLILNDPIIFDSPSRGSSLGPGAWNDASLRMKPESFR